MKDSYPGVSEWACGRPGVCAAEHGGPTDPHVTSGALRWTWALCGKICKGLCETGGSPGEEALEHHVS